MSDEEIAAQKSTYIHVCLTGVPEDEIITIDIPPGFEESYVLRIYDGFNLLISIDFDWNITIHDESSKDKAMKIFYHYMMKWGKSAIALNKLKNALEEVNKL